MFSIAVDILLVDWLRQGLHTYKFADGIRCFVLALMLSWDYEPSTCYSNLQKCPVMEAHMLLSEEKTGSLRADHPHPNIRSRTFSSKNKILRTYK